MHNSALKNISKLILCSSARYPGTEDKVTMDEALNAINLASTVRQAVRNALTEEGMTLVEIFRSESHSRNDYKGRN